MAEAAGAWSQESREGLRALTARSAAAATARGGQCRWAAQRGVGGVRGAGGEGVHEGPERLVVAGSVFGQYVAQRGGDAGGDGVGAAGGKGAAAGGGTGAECVEDGVEEGPQRVGAAGASGERGQRGGGYRGRVHAGSSRVRGGGAVRVSGGRCGSVRRRRGRAPDGYNDQTRMG
ncbi:hypothetical protein GCM10020254_61630 [Streptomyces goshikiensis]